MQKLISISSFILIFSLASCGAKPLTNEELYDNACKDAVFATEDKIKPIVEITKDSKDVKWNDNGQVLMCSFHHYPSSYIEGTTTVTSWGESWLVSVKEFSNWYKQEKGKFSDYLMRTRQIMGVDPNKAHTHISSFYVNPADLFRPAYEPDIRNQVVDLSFPDGVSNEFVSWFKENTYYSYFQANPRLPWTRLGYTYDWSAGGDSYGLSEFILKKDSEITIERTAPVEEFYTYLETI